MKIKHLLITLASLLILGCESESVPEYTLSVSAEEGGVVNISEKIFTEGQTATIQATANEFYEFSGWSGDINSNANPVNITMDRDKTVKALFKTLDTDGDGVSDSVDQCNDTSAGASVDVNGCSDDQKDTDGDGITDDIDACSNTPMGDEVDSVGCTVNPLYLADNGITIKAKEWARIGYSGIINGKEYTIVDESTLRQMIARDEDVSQTVTSFVTDMENLFENKRTFNQDISHWDVSNVLIMRNMFAACSNFNADISLWDTSNVRDMAVMFANTHAFNQDISNWDVSNVEDMFGMFFVSTVFNQDISPWNVSKVQTMESMFANAFAFNQDLSNWQVQNVERCNGFSANVEDWSLPKPNFTACDPR